MDYFTVFFILLGILFFLLFIGQKVCFALAITSVIGFVIIKIRAPCSRAEWWHGTL